MHYPSDVRKPPFGSYVASKSLTILTRKRGYGTYRRMILSRRAHGGAGDADAWRCLGSNDMQRLYVAETQKNPEFATEASSLIYQRIGPWKVILGTKMSPLKIPPISLAAEDIERKRLHNLGFDLAPSMAPWRGGAVVRDVGRAALKSELRVSRYFEQS